MGKHIVLVNLPPAARHDYGKTSMAYPATGVLIVGTVLKSLGFDVKVVDGAIESDYAERVLAAVGEDTVMVGFSVMTSQVPMALRVASLVKKHHPGVFVVWGGIHPILFPVQTAEHPDVDMVVTGEGHRTTLDIVEFIKGDRKAEDIRGVAFKGVSGEVVSTPESPPDDIEELPHIDFSILDDNEAYFGAESVFAREIGTDGREPLRVMPVITALGCCYKCRFCINVILRRGYRFRSARSIVDEVKRLQSEYGANAFVFYDEDFFISKKRLREFVRLVEAEGLHFYWRTWGRVNYFKESYLSRAFVERLDSIGLRSIAMGAESGSQEILDSIAKGIKVEDIVHSARTLSGTRITARYSFIVGLEGETRSDTRATYGLASKLMEVNPGVDIAGPFIFRYYPGSPIFERITARYGIRVPERLEQWEGALHDEGFLKIDEMPWVWPGCMEAVGALNTAVNIHNKLRRKNGFMARTLRGVLRWRLRHFDFRLPMENYLAEAGRKFYFRCLALRKPFRGRPGVAAQGARTAGRDTGDAGDEKTEAEY